VAKAGNADSLENMAVPVAASFSRGADNDVRA
jgi:hypothetical protein